MSKLIKNYLEKFHTDNTDNLSIDNNLSALSVPTLPSIEKNNIVPNNDPQNSSHRLNLKIKKHLTSNTDNADKSWLTNAKECFKQQAIHYETKKSLGDRIHILRVLIGRFLNEINKDGIATDHEIEAFLDFELINYNYNLEDAITAFRQSTLQPTLICKCGYQSVFCSCEGISTKNLVRCHDCKNFTPDKIGDGTGIGACKLGIESTQELSGMMPLFRYANRHCNKFSAVSR